MYIKYVHKSSIYVCLYMSTSNFYTYKCRRAYGYMHIYVHLIYRDVLYNQLHGYLSGSQFPKDCFHNSSSLTPHLSSLGSLLSTCLSTSHLLPSLLSPPCGVFFADNPLTLTKDLSAYRYKYSFVIFIYT